MAKTFAGLIDASKRQLDANRGGASGSRRGSPSATVDGGARLSSSTRAPTAGPRAAFGSSFFGHFKWNIGGPSKPKEPEMTKPRRWPRLSKLQAVTLFDRLYASRPKTLPRDDPDETFAPKISAKTKRLAAAVRAKENQGVDRIEYLHNKGTKEIREVNDKKLLAEGWMHSDEARREQSHDRRDGLRVRSVWQAGQGHGPVPRGATRRGGSKDRREVRVQAEAERED